jgi:hypothetical protein
MESVSKGEKKKRERERKQKKWTKERKKEKEKSKPESLICPRNGLTIVGVQRSLSRLRR